MSNFYGQKLPIKFKQITDAEYLSEISKLYNRYIENLEDDFSPLRSSPQKLSDFIEKVRPHFYIILFDNDFCGFIVLENIVGNQQCIHSAEVLICLKRKYWGKTSLFAAKTFRNYCFKILKIKKLKALIYPQNNLVKRLLKKCGFAKEALLKSETVKNNQLQDIEVYTLFNEEKGGSNAI